MQSTVDSVFLARVEPIDDRDAGRVLTFGWKLLLNASLLLMPVLMVALFIPILGLAVLIGSSKSLLVAAVVIPVIFATQISWAGTYPEWPMNQLLVWRLRRACRSRLRGPGSAWIETARMVEWVPRENWNATKLDTAEDVMLIRIGDFGVEMEGDRSHYLFPPASIIDVQLETIRPSG